MSRATLGWIVLGWVGFALLPWYGFDSARCTDLRRLLRQRIRPRARSYGSLVASADPRAALLTLRPCAGRGPTAARKATWLVASGLLGLGLIVLQGFTIGLNGWTLDILKSLFGEPGPAPGRHGLRRGADRDCVPDHSLPRPCGARLVPRRRFRRLLDRHRHRADRRLRVLPGLHHPGERLRRRQRQLRAGRSSCHEVLRPLDLGPRLPCRATCAAAWPGTRCSSACSSASAPRLSASPSR